MGRESGVKIMFYLRDFVSSFAFNSYLFRKGFVIKL